MAERLPAAIQPFLTWLTARPAPGEAARPRSARSYVAGALAWTLLGCALTVLPFAAGMGALATWLLVPLGLLATSCGLGIFQVVIFHHCSHGTVFATRETNRRVGGWSPPSCCSSASTTTSTSTCCTTAPRSC
jgi:fatty acid desaturase